MCRQVVLTLVALTPLAYAGGNAMWGSCDRWDRDRSGCHLTSGHKCNAYLSSGPADATFELILADLPPSTNNKSVHLQWFAPYEAPEFNPLTYRPVWRVYNSPKSAYPKFSDEEFNGGNVRVNETGHAVLRLKAPSTYHVCRNLIRYPHVHIRFCHGEDYVVDRAETVDFGFQGPVVRGCNGKRFKVQSFRNITDKAYKQHPLLDKTRTTTSKIVDTSKLATTTNMPTTSKFLNTGASEEKDGHLVGNSSFDWDALEFSPVYQCLLERKVYDLTGEGCVDTCPATTELKHGQCVRKAVGIQVQLQAAWHLQVHCDDACWKAKTSRTRHILRLAAADHLDIPFQEVLNVVLRPELTSSRRLAEKEMSAASLYLSINTTRIGASKGQELLEKFIKNIDDASQILGLEVQGLTLVKDTPVQDALDALKSGEAEDEFAQFYSEVEGEDTVVLGSDTTEGLPLAAIVAIAGCVLVLGGLISAGLWFKRRQQLRQAIESNEATIKAMQVEMDGTAKLGKEEMDDNAKADSEVQNQVVAEDDRVIEVEM